MAGLSGNVGLIASSIQYVINVIMTIPALIWMDRWGRRPMFVIGAVLMMTWLFANAGLMATYGSPAPPGGLDNIAEQSWQIHGSPANAVIACTYLFVASYAPTWGPASWVYPPELFPLRVRGKAVALTTSSNWIFVSQALLVLKDRLTDHSRTLLCPTSSLPLSSTSSGRFTSSSVSSARPWRSTHSSCFLRQLERPLRILRRCSWKVSPPGRPKSTSALPVVLSRVSLIQRNLLASTTTRSRWRMLMLRLRLKFVYSRGGRG